MQVSFKSLHVFNYPQYNFNNTSNTPPQHIAENPNFQLPNYEQCACSSFFFNTDLHIEKRYIQKIKQLLKNENGNFSIENAAKYIKQLTDNQLLLYSSADIDNVIAKVINDNPDIDKADVLKMLAQLTSFSSYNSLNAIEEYCKSENITQIYPTQKLTINNIFQYLSKFKKSILKLPNTDTNTKIGLFIDRNTIEEFKELKENSPDNFENLKSDILNGQIKLILPDGWEAKTSEGMKSFNFVGAWGNLANTTSALLKEQSKTTESVFNSDIIKNINQLFNQDMPVDIIRNIPDTINSNIIAERLNPKTLNEKDIIKIIKTASEFIFAPNTEDDTLEELCEQLPTLQNEKINIENKDLKKFLKSNAHIQGKKTSIQELLSLMFIYTCNVYSPRKIALELSELSQKLADRCFYYDKQASDMLFIVPKKDKSFGLINYQYSKVNNIPLENYIYSNKNNLTINEKQCKNKVFVLLDDFSGSGHSMMWELLPYHRFKTLNKQPLIFSALTYIPKAKQAIEEEINNTQSRLYIKDSFVGGKMIKTFNDLARLIAHRKTNLINQCIDSGYHEGGCTIAFPHVIPDNCIDVSGLILENLLRNKSANKAEINQYKLKLLSKYSS